MNHQIQLHMYGKYQVAYELALRTERGGELALFLYAG